MIKAVSYDDIQSLNGESELNLEEILNLFDKMIWDKKSFISFPINDINLFQIMGTNEYDKYLIEITNDSFHMIFHQKYATKKECLEMIEKVYKISKIDASLIADFYKVPILSKNIDDIIKEKR